MVSATEEEDVKRFEEKSMMGRGRRMSSGNKAREICFEYTVEELTCANTVTKSYLPFFQCHHQLGHPRSHSLV